MCDSSEINVILAYWLLCVIVVNKILFKPIDYYVWLQWNKCYSSLLIVMWDSSEINVIQAYWLLCVIAVK